MKTYKLLAGDKIYTVAGLTDDVKTDLVDIVQAQEKNRNHKQLKKGLIDAEVYTTNQQSIQGIGFASEAVIKHLATQRGKKDLYRAMLEHGGKYDTVSDEQVNAVLDAAEDDTSEAWTVVQQIWEDALPKGRTPPRSTQPAAETPCEQSSSTCPTPSSTSQSES